MVTDTSSNAWTLIALGYLSWWANAGKADGLINTCVQKPTTKNKKTKLLFLDAVSVYFHRGIPKLHYF